jgi:CheY-like chemotaxis protein/Tfp pilus assembly protein PilZ
MFKAKILLVDDVKVFLDIQKEYLRPSPVRVLTAKNGVEALETARHEKPDLVVMDVQLPVMDGIECCAAIKGDPVLGATPVILLSSNTSTEVVQSSHDAGCARFLQKPVLARTFLGAVHSVLPMIERRRPRVLCQVPVTMEVGGVVAEGMSWDVSMSGMYVATGREVAPGSEIVVSFRLQTGSEAMTVIRGRVVWTYAPEQQVARPAGFGIEFREIMGAGVSQLRFYELSEFINGYPCL